jgi:hypothetical protein
MTAGKGKKRKKRRDWGEDGGRKREGKGRREERQSWAAWQY